MCRHAQDGLAGGHVPQDNAACTDARVSSDVATRQHDGVRAHEDRLFDDHGPGNVGVTIEGRERADLRVVADRDFQIQMDVIADRDVCGQHHAGAQDRPDTDAAVRADDGRGMNDRGELHATLQLFDDLHLHARLANGDEDAIAVLEALRVDVADHSQVAGKIPQGRGIVVQEANQVPVLLGLAKIAAPGGDLSTEPPRAAIYKRFFSISLPY